MSPIDKSRENLVKQTIESAKRWERKGDTFWAAFCILSALESRIVIALCQLISQDAILSSLRRGTFCAELKWYCETLLKCRSLMEKDKLPESMLGGNYSILIVHHFARLLGLGDEEKILLDTATCTAVASVSTDFWNAYAMGIEAIAHGKEFAYSHSMRFDGIEKHWQPYLDLMESIATGSDLSSRIQQADQAFQKMINESRDNPEHPELEATAERSHNWDYRKSCILSYVN